LRPPSCSTDQDGQKRRDGKYIGSLVSQLAKVHRRHYLNAKAALEKAAFAHEDGLEAYCHESNTPMAILRIIADWPNFGKSGFLEIGAPVSLFGAG